MKLGIPKFNKPCIRSFCSFALPLILLLQISLPGVVLCFGDDGHVALENYSDQLCDEIISEFASQDNSKFTLQTQNSSNNQHCGTCVDIQISDNNSENKVISSNDLMPEIDTHAFHTYELSYLDYQETSAQSFEVQELPTGSTFLDSLQTTIIIC